MNKFQKWLFATIILGVISVLYVFPLLKKHKTVNPEVFMAFRKIEKLCNDCVLRPRVNPQQYEQCKKVVELEKRAMNSEFYEAEEYYQVLERLGFNLPPLYKDREQK